MAVLVGIENMEEAIKKIADGGPDVITMHKGLARQDFLPLPPQPGRSGSGSGRGSEAGRLMP